MEILFVENHDRFVETVLDLFLQDHEVTVVASVREANRVLDRRDFDVLLIDYDLDDAKGTDVVSHAKRLGRTAAIVAVSSHDVGNAALLASGADAQCSKMRFSTIGAVLSSLH